MLDAMKSLRDEMLALRNKESDVDKTSDSAQAKPMPGPSKTNPTQTSYPVHKSLNPSVVYTRILTRNAQNKLPIPRTTRQDLNIKNIPTRGNISPPEPQPQATSDLVFYREVDMNDLPSQYTEEIETFRQILDLPDPRETMPRSATTVLGLDDEKGQQELRPLCHAPSEPFSQGRLREIRARFLGL